MRHFAAGFAACALLAFASLAGANGDDPWRVLRGLVASDTAQDARIEALETRLASAEQRARLERRSRVRIDRWIAECGRVAFRDIETWERNQPAFWRHGRKEIVACFRGARKNARHL